MADEKAELEKRLESLLGDISAREAELTEIENDPKKLSRAVQINAEMNYLRDQVGKTRRQQHEAEERARQAEIEEQKAQEGREARVKNAMLELQRAALDAKDSVVHIDPESMQRAVDDAADALKKKPKVRGAAKAFADAVAKMREAAQAFDEALREAP